MLDSVVSSKQVDFGEALVLTGSYAVAVSVEGRTAILSGTTTVSSSQGIVRFTDLHLDVAATQAPFSSLATLLAVSAYAALTRTLVRRHSLSFSLLDDAGATLHTDTRSIAVTPGPPYQAGPLRDFHTRDWTKFVGFVRSFLCVKPLLAAGKMRVQLLKEC